MRIGRYTNLQLNTNDYHENYIIRAICEIFDLTSYRLTIRPLPLDNNQRTFTWSNIVVEVEKNIYFEPLSGSMVTINSILEDINKRFNTNYTKHNTVAQMSITAICLFEKNHMKLLEDTRKYILSNKVFLKTFANLPYDGKPKIFSEDVRNIINVTLIKNHRL